MPPDREASKLARKGQLILQPTKASSANSTHPANETQNERQKESRAVFDHKLNSKTLFGITSGTY
jgi:hypothetical protein